MKLHKLCLVFLFVPALLPVRAQQQETEDFSVHFQLSSAELQKSFDDNSTVLNRIYDFFKMVENTDTIDITKVTFYGSTSPEGSYEYNHKLALNRRDSLVSAVTSKVNIPAESIRLDDNYMDWEILKQELKNCSAPWRDKALEIIDRPAKLIHFYDDLKIDERVIDLINLDGGRAWPVLLDKYFPAMRMAGLIVNTTKEVRLPEPEPEPEIEEIVTEEVMEVVPEAVPVIEKDEFVRRFTIKSNAIGWALTQANIGVEIDICKHLSFSVPVYWSTLNYFTRKIKFRTFNTQPEFRVWFKETNDGFYIGPHFGYGAYNYAWNGKYRYQDHNEDTPAIGGGLSFGYRMPISKNKRWKVEFSIGAGCYKLYYDKFVNEKDGPYIGSEKKTWFGLDQLAVSFSYSFPLRKGGKQ